MFTKLKGSYKCCKQLRCKKKLHAMQNYAVKVLLTSPETLTMQKVCTVHLHVLCIQYPYTVITGNDFVPTTLKTAFETYKDKLKGCRSCN